LSNVKKISLIFLILTLIGTTCLAKGNRLKKMVNEDVIPIVDSSNYRKNIKEEVTYDNVNYKLTNIKEVENKKELEIEKEIQKDLIVNTNNEKKILEQFEKSKTIVEDGYVGEIYIQNDTLKISDNESYKEEYKVQFQKKYNNVNSNELNNIPKEIKKEGIIYYLVNPMWDIAKTENIDGKEIPILYNGIMNYEGVKTRVIVKNYKATVKYSGILKKEITDSITFTREYEEVPKETNYFAPTVTTVGSIILFVGIVIIKRNNVKLYNYNYKNNKYKLVKMIYIDSKKAFINITPLKTMSNKYKIVLSNKLYNKLKNSSIQIKYFDKNVNYIITQKEFEINA